MALSALPAVASSPEAPPARRMASPAASSSGWKTSEQKKRVSGNRTRRYPMTRGAATSTRSLGRQADTWKITPSWGVAVCTVPGGTSTGVERVNSGWAGTFEMADV